MYESERLCLKEEWMNDFLGSKKLKVIFWKLIFPDELESMPLRRKWVSFIFNGNISPENEDDEEVNDDDEEEQKRVSYGRPI